jgi:DNA-directed RNA polymerase subunit H (RpoH/RPB5)
MTFTDAISNKYITDYKIWMPSIHENNEELDKELSIYEIDNKIKNRCKFLYSCIANNGSRKCIVYCKDTEDMNAIMECMITLNEFYIMDIAMNSISCEDNEKKRKRVLKSFSNGDDKIQLLFNIRILNECIDIPACDSVYISYPPKNKITTIQRISRSTRIDKNNPYKVANIYIWCEEYDDMLETLSSIKEYDIMFKDKVKVSAVDFYNNNDEKELELIEKDKVLLSYCIIGVKEFRMISWEEKLAMVEEYIKEYGRLPTSHNTDKYISSLASWVSTQRQNYKKNEKIMKNKNIRKLWDDFVKQYNHLFMSNRELWINNLKLLEEYINIHKELPSDYSKDPNTLKIARWKCTQKQNFKNTSHIMKEDENIRDIWEEFVKRHYKLFRTNEEKWLDYLKELEEYIKIHNQLPSHTNIDENISLLAKWTTNQKRNYVYRNQIMNNDEIRKLWEEFVNKYQEVFKTTEEIWKDNLNNLKEYINIHNKLPTSCNQDETIKSLGLWTRNQAKNYDNKQYIMKNEVIQTLWEEFMKDNNKLFLNNEESWIENKNKVEEYIRLHNKLPAGTDKIQDIAVLATWVYAQKQNYKNRSHIMIDETIRTIWGDFIKQYEKYFISNEEIWMTRFDEFKEYINIHKKLPPSRDKELDTLVQWVRHQRRNYDNRNQIMKNEDIRKLWKEFTDNNTELFITADEIWIENKNKVEDYIQQFNKLPSQANKDKTISSLASWVSSQKQNYKNREHIMKNNNDIVKEWECFIEKHSILFRSNEEVWMDTLHKVCEYIKEHNKRPSATNKDKGIGFLGSWVSSNKQNYEKKELIMGNEEIRVIWKNFIDENQTIFMSNDELWKRNIVLLEEYVIKNDRLPTVYMPDEYSKKLGRYVHHQKYNYKNNKDSMKYPKIRKEWEDLTSKYPHLF